MSSIAQWFSKKSSKLIVAGCLFAVAGGIILFRLLSHETLEEAALRFDHCLLTQNTGCMYDYMHPDEVTLLQISEGDFDKFMHSFVYVELEGFSPSGGIQLELKDDITQLYLSSFRVFRHPDGREVNMVFQIHMGDEQPRVINALMSLVIFSCYADLDPGEPVPTGPSKPKFLVECYTKHMPTWEAANLYGYTRVRYGGDDPNTFEYRRFDDAIRGLTMAIARAESK